MKNVRPTSATEALVIREPGAALASQNPAQLAVDPDVLIVLDARERNNRAVVESIAAALAS